MADMIELFKKAMLTGVGLALKSKDEIEEFLNDFEERLDVSEKDGRQFVEDFQKRYDEAQDKLEKRVEKAVKNFMKQADVVTGDELRALKKEIRELKKAIGNDKDAGD